LPAPEIEQQHYGESFAAERLQILQHACKLAHETATEQGKKYKFNYDSKAAPQKFKIGQKIFLNDSTALGKTQNFHLTGQVLMKSLISMTTTQKLKSKTSSRIKPFLEEPTNCLPQDDSSSSQRSPTGLDHWMGSLKGQ